MICSPKSRQEATREKTFLEYAYHTYDNVVAVTDDIVAPTQILAGKDKKINIVKKYYLTTRRFLQTANSL